MISDDVLIGCAGPVCQSNQVCYISGCHYRRVRWVSGCHYDVRRMGAVYLLEVVAEC